MSSGSWGAGSSANGLDTGARANSTYYNVFDIINNSTNANDILYSTSRTSPTIPSGYTLVAWKGRIKTDSSGNIDQNEFSTRTNFGQFHYYKIGSFASGTTQIPFDDTIPQNTEGTEFMKTNFVPLKIGSKIELNVKAFNTNSTQNVATLGALFKTGSTDALASNYQLGVLAEGGNILSIDCYDIPNSTNAIDYSLRLGGSNASTIYFNGLASGRRFGGNLASTIIIKEYV